jgi:hypothetical protein
MKRCIICNGEIYPEQDGVNQHDDSEYCLVIALACAASLEDENAVLRAQLERKEQLLSIAIDCMPEEVQNIVALRWVLSSPFSNELPTMTDPAPQEEPTP